jgi:hypothetical protein
VSNVRDNRKAMPYVAPPKIQEGFMKKDWLIAGVILSCTLGVSLGACSSSSNNGTGNSTTGSSSNSTSATGGTTGSSTSSTATATGTGGTGTGGLANDGCGAAGTLQSSLSLHPPTPDAGPGSIYCPFSGVDGGHAEYCTAGTQHCCETPEGSTPSACMPSATACTTGTGYTDWQCEDPVTDCASGQDCCSDGMFVMGVTVAAGQCENYASKMTKTTCVAKGSCTGFTLCTSTSECPSGKTCTALEKAGNQIGSCQ